MIEIEEFTSVSIDYPNDSLAATYKIGDQTVYPVRVEIVIDPNNFLEHSVTMTFYDLQFKGDIDQFRAIIEPNCSWWESFKYYLSHHLGR